MQFFGSLFVSLLGAAGLANALPSPGIPSNDKDLAIYPPVDANNTTSQDVVIDVVLFNGTEWISSRERFSLVSPGWASIYGPSGQSSVGSVLYSPILDYIDNAQLLVLDDVSFGVFSSLANSVTGYASNYTQSSSNSTSTMNSTGSVSGGSVYPTNSTTNSSISWNSSTSAATNTSSSSSSSSQSSVVSVNSEIFSYFGLSQQYVNYSTSRLCVVGTPRANMSTVSVTNNGSAVSNYTVNTNGWTSSNFKCVDDVVANIFGLDFYTAAVLSEVSILRSFALCNATTSSSLFRQIASYGVYGSFHFSSSESGSFANLIGTNNYFMTDVKSSSVVIVQSETSCSINSASMSSNTTYFYWNSTSSLSSSVFTNTTSSSNSTNSSIPTTYPSNSTTYQNITTSYPWSQPVVNITDYLSDNGDGHFVLAGDGNQTIGDFYVMNWTTIASGEYLVPFNY
ncbi:Schizosaccharomyces specific protein [Schizosaccharomyces pombe]|uniref:Uncharacterized protein C685.03 n=1 Tax=Schizosaccharomyces pombe (strain 972 / ATCC 24843) TaxID=284812 RepID=YGJ3_SCHPO|nr:uncharacterized protein SPBC685.03 [Schizosaccharomyces pombe]Q9Y7L5.1 RecName: Full=Uncharacterized protein C685.03; Flags: Precursor [Schizosaccharomyces pombe 972h-]CAB39360.1 sequence orphan [Schizosaccharomyces pombe]|eukprot:NP_596137.1 uncharacterized protein SPBC685.03 [Schizosaccharomyces pombe]